MSLLIYIFPVKIQRLSSFTWCIYWKWDKWRLYSILSHHKKVILKLLNILFYIVQILNVKQKMVLLHYILHQKKVILVLLNTSFHKGYFSQMQLHFIYIHIKLLTIQRFSANPPLCSIKTSWPKNSSFGDWSPILFCHFFLCRLFLCKEFTESINILFKMHYIM